MAVDHLSIHSISNSLTLAPYETSMRYHLNTLSIHDLELVNNQILTGYIDIVLDEVNPTNLLLTILMSFTLFSEE